MPLVRNKPDATQFNEALDLPFNLRIDDFKSAMQDVYDFFYDVNKLLLAKGLQRMDDMVRAAGMSGMISDMLTASVANHSRSLVQNKFFNGHPDLIVQGIYAGDSVQSRTDGVEIKATRKAGGAVDTHGARDQWMCVFDYTVDNETEPAVERKPLNFTEAYLGKVTVADFRSNARGALGTRTATLDKLGIAKLRKCWLYGGPPTEPKARVRRPPRN